eukprot:615855-Amphidinium_carterae.1
MTTEGSLGPFACKRPSKHARRIMTCTGESRLRAVLDSQGILFATTWNNHPRMSRCSSLQDTTQT